MERFLKKSGPLNRLRVETGFKTGSDNKPVLKTGSKSLMAFKTSLDLVPVLKTDPFKIEPVLNQFLKMKPVTQPKKNQPNLFFRFQVVFQN